MEIYNLPDSVHAIFIDSLVADTTLTVDGLLTDSLYLWRVKGGNSYGWGPYSQNWRFAFHSITGVQEGGPTPSKISLGSNYPNPFNSNTVISFNLPKGTSAELGIFDIGGRLIRHYRIPGSSAEKASRIVWDGTDALGYSVKSGVYFYQLKAAGKTFSDKMILLR